MAKTYGRLTGVKGRTDTTKTATGTLAMHVEASNEDGIVVYGMVRPLDAASREAGVIARAGIKVDGRWVAELFLHPDGRVTMLDTSAAAGRAPVEVTH